MENGKIEKWNDEKGYGFIKPISGNKEVFVHISAFSTKNRRPKVGDRVCYESIIENSGKEKAKFVSYLDNIENGASNGNYRINNSSNFEPRNIRRIVGKFVLIIVLPLAIIYSCVSKSKHAQYENETKIQSEIAPKIEKIEEKEKFRCEGKRHCGQMVSKEEAQFYLNNCPHDGMDGDNDGIACEQQFGN